MEASALHLYYLIQNTKAYFNNPGLCATLKRDSNHHQVPYKSSCPFQLRRLIERKASGQGRNVSFCWPGRLCWRKQRKKKELKRLDSERWLRLAKKSHVHIITCDETYGPCSLCKWWDHMDSFHHSINESQWTQTLLLRWMHGLFGVDFQQ